MRTWDWWKLITRNGFRISPRRLPIACGVSLFTPCNDLLALIQSSLYGKQIAKTEISRAPVFVLGHWRSGTTFLHELLVTDPQFASPTTYQCFAPWHFLLTQKPMIRMGGFLLPEKRPMDNMSAGWELPQEDEFALMNLGVPSTYLRIAFPQTEPQRLEYLELQPLSEQELAAWRNRFRNFLQCLTFHYSGKQLVLKSPPHTGRLRELIRMFPNAKFIHLTRDPRQLFSSTVRLWRSLDEVQGLHATLPEEELQEYVLTCLERMYAAFQRDRPTISSSQIVDLRYEDLVAEPMEKMQWIYETLDLGDFEALRPGLTERLTGHAGYRPNRHILEAELEDTIRRRWNSYFEAYGYE